MQSVRLLVTGGTGHLGGELIRQAAGREVFATFHHRPAADAGGVQWRSLDVRRRPDVEALLREIRPAAVIHTAYRQSDWHATASGAAHIAAAAAELGARLVHVSSDALFSGRNSPYDEDAVPDPITPYGAAKAAAETAVAAIAPTAVIARTSLILGGGDSPTETLVHAIASGDRTGALFPDNIRCPIHVTDLAAAVLELMASDHSGIAHLGGPEAVSRYQLGCLIAARDGLDPATLPQATSPSDIRLDSAWTQGLISTRLRGASEFLRAAT